MSRSSRRWALLAVAGASLAQSFSLNPSVLFAKRASSECPSSYTTPTNLDFDTYCGQDQPGWDLHPADSLTVITTNENTMEACMDQCATTRPLCYGIAFDYTDGTCWTKNETFTYVQSATIQTTKHLGVARHRELVGYDTACPYNNGSTQSVRGLKFDIHCEQDIVGGDYDPYTALNGFYHATSLSDCMSQCYFSQPLCQGVAYNPGLGAGYANCYPKFNFTQGFVTSDGNGNSNFTTHSAVARIPKINVTCKDQQVIASSNGTGYTLSCDQDRPGNDLSKYHDENLENCVTSCEQYTAGNCRGVIFDTRMQSGYENCYLKGGIGTPETDGKQGFILALQGGTVDSTTNGTGNGTDSGNGSGNNNGTSGNGSNGNSGSSTSNSAGPGPSGLSPGAIAGIVVGAVAGLLLLAVAAFFLLRKRYGAGADANDPNAPAAVSNASPETSQQTPGYSGVADYKYAGAAAYSHPPPEGPPQEMADQVRQELPGEPVRPQELPAHDVHYPAAR